MRIAVPAFAAALVLMLWTISAAPDGEILANLPAHFAVYIVPALLGAWWTSRKLRSLASQPKDEAV